MAGLEYYREATVPEIRDRALRAARMLVANGTLYTRTHMDVDAVAGTRGVEGVLLDREVLKGLIDMQVVAFAQSGFLRDAEAARLVRAVLEMGCDLVGSLDPATRDRDVERATDITFGLAGEFGVGVDYHVDDPGTVGLFSLQRLAERAIDHGLHGRVTVSHAFCLADSRGAGLTSQLPSSRRQDSSWSAVT